VALFILSHLTRGFLRSQAGIPDPGVLHSHPSKEELDILVFPVHSLLNNERKNSLSQGHSKLNSLKPSA